MSSLLRWGHIGWPGDHADLWNLLASELLSRACDVTVSWVKGHAKDIDVARGRTTREDKMGNDGADKLAVAGAAAHKVAVEVVQAAADRRQVATQTYKMMLSILLARQACEYDVSCEGIAGLTLVIAWSWIAWNLGDRFGIGARSGQP